MKSNPFKARYTIIEPGKIEVDALYAMKWTDCELPYLSTRKVENPAFRDQDTLDLHIVGQLLNGPYERVHVNSFEGGADMFVGDRSAALGRIYKNDGATLIYWTATAMHWIARNIGEPPTYAEMQKTALKYAAEAMNGFGPLVTELRESTPRIYGRAVLFDREVWW